MHINPPAAVLGREHAILHGVGREYSVRGFEGPLSIKTVRRGSAVWRTDDGEHRLGPGRTLVLNRGRRYDIEIDAADPVETFCVFFADGFADELARARRSGDEALLEMPERPERPELIESIEKGGPDIARLLANLEVAGTDGDDPTDLLIELAVAIFDRDTRLRGLSRRLPAVRPSTRREMLARVLQGRDRLESEWDATLSLETLARSAGMAPHHFHRSFRRVFGVTPLEYQTALRMEAAKRRLAESDEPVQDVCVAVGLQSVPSFTRAFRRHAGTTPAAWRTQFRKIR